MYAYVEGTPMLMMKKRMVLLGDIDKPGQSTTAFFFFFKVPYLLFYFLPLQGALCFLLLAAHTRPLDRSSEARLGRAWTVHHDDSDSRCNSLPDSSPNLPGDSDVELLGAHRGQDAAVTGAP